MVSISFTDVAEHLHTGEYKPILKEVERILAEAGLDDDEIKRAGASGHPSQGKSRNRR